jgi:nicotinate phosphoribosyltransferase
MRIAAGADKQLLEFGLRRAQGPDGGVTASKYAVLGGFDASSNIVAGKLFGITVKGTHAHSFVMSYISIKDLSTTTITDPSGEEVEFVARVLEKRKQLNYIESNNGELAAFISYAQAFSNGFLALIDTYDTLKSGIQNFICVGWVLMEIGYKPLGIRLDSGDLAYLSRKVRELFHQVDVQYGLPQSVLRPELCFTKLSIVASNDINEDVLISLNREGHAIDVFGIGTHLVTCQRQPALGCVYKLVELNGKSRIKLSQESEKIVIPGKKRAFRLFGSDDIPLVDLLQTVDEEPPQVGKRILVRHPFHENKRAYVTPKRVEELLSLLYDGGKSFEAMEELIANWNLVESRARCLQELASLR